MNIIELYDKEVPRRQWWLNEAYKVGRITSPDLNTLGDYYNTANGPATVSNGIEADIYALHQPWSDDGGQANSELAHGIRNLILSPSSPWFRLGPPADYIPLLTPEIRVGLDKQLADGEFLVTSKMAEHGVYGKAGNGFRRLLIEGQILSHVTDDFYRVIPLRCFTVNRNNGVVERVIIKEELNEYDEGKQVCLYTLVDFNAEKVYQQKSGVQNAKVVDFKPSQYFVTTTIEPHEGCDYSVSFASLYYGTIWAVNFYSKKIQEITHNASINLIGLDPGLQMTVSEFKEKMQKGDNIFSWPPLPDGRMAGVSFFSAQTQLPNLAALHNELARHQAVLAKAFSLGINSSDTAIAGRERVTAQEILARSQQIDANTQSHASTLQSTYQQPLVNAYLDLQKVQITLNDGKPAVRPIILAGANMLSRMVQANALLGTVDSITTRNQQYIARINYDEVFMEVATAQGLQNPERFLNPVQPQMPQQQPPSPMGGQQAA